jgi:hypothetical protein
MMSSSNYNSLPVSRLRQLACMRNIVGRSRLKTKSNLIAALRSQYTIISRPSRRCGVDLETLEERKMQIQFFKSCGVSLDKLIEFLDIVCGKAVLQARCNYPQNKRKTVIGVQRYAEQNCVPFSLMRRYTVMHEMELSKFLAFERVRMNVNVVRGLRFKPFSIRVQSSLFSAGSADYKTAEFSAHCDRSPFRSILSYTAKDVNKSNSRSGYDWYLSVPACSFDEVTGCIVVQFPDGVLLTLVYDNMAPQWSDYLLGGSSSAQLCSGQLNGCIQGSASVGNFGWYIQMSCEHNQFSSNTRCFVYGSVYMLFFVVNTFLTVCITHVNTLLESCIVLEQVAAAAQHSTSTTEDNYVITTHQKNCLPPLHQT